MPPKVCTRCGCAFIKGDVLDIRTSTHHALEIECKAALKREHKAMREALVNLTDEAERVALARQDEERHGDVQHGFRYVHLENAIERAKAALGVVHAKTNT